YAVLAARGMADGLVDSGIDLTALEGTLQEALDAGVLGADLLPAGVGLAVVGLAAFMDGSAALEERAARAGEAMGGASVSIAAAQGALVASQVWWIALAAGVSTSWLARTGRGKRAQLDALRQVVDSLPALTPLPAPA